MRVALRLEAHTPLESVNVRAFSILPPFVTAAFALSIATPDAQAQSAPELVIEQPAGTELLRGASGVIGWGNSSDGAITVPVAAQSGVVAIAAGAYHSVALKSDGSVLAWGGNSNGQSTVPAAAQADVVAIAAGRYHTLALKRNGAVIGWGSNFNGETTIPAAAQSRVQAIAAGGYQSVALEIGGPSAAFGSQLAGSTSAAKIFTVKKTGTGSLTLTSVGVTGENTNDFTPNTDGLAGSVPAGGETTFSVTFTPVGVGPRATTLRIVSDDSDESQFDIRLTGAGVNNLPTLAIAAPGMADEDSSVSFTFTATDTDAADQATGFAWNINWSDGSASQTVPAGTSSPLMRTHTFAQPGSYTVLATVTDGNGGMSSVAMHAITIRDVTPPLFTSVSPNRVIEATNTNGASVSYAAATATDNSGLAPAIAYSQESGTLFPFGTTVVTVTARDAANNVAATSFNVTVQDTAGPVVTVPASPIVAEATSPSGAVVSFTVSASDAVDGPVPAMASPASGSLFALGDTTVNVTAMDSRGNPGTGAFVVRVRDTTKPVITTPGDLTVTTTSASGTAVTFEVSASDTVSGAVPAVASPASGSIFPVGITTVTVTATDGAGNQQTASFTVTVRNTSPQVAVDSTDGAGTFSSTGSLVTGRQLHTATLLNNGKVLVTGGVGAGYLKSAELYDPLTGQWTATASLGSPRTSHTATLLPNGKVLVASGYYETFIVKTAELYDPATGQWTATASLADGRYGHTATALTNGKVLVTGGIKDSAYVVTAELYDSATGQWTAAGSLAPARSSHTATLLADGKVLVAGGDGNAGKTRTAFLYSPETGQWTATGSLAIARSRHTATLLSNGKVLVAGGRFEDNSRGTTSAELYDPVTGQWTPTGSLAAARGTHTATRLVNGKVLATGGESSTNLNSAELYDPASGQWTATASLATVRNTHTATLLANGKVLVAGGYGNTLLSSAELYGPAVVVATAAEGSPTTQTGTFSDPDGNGTVTLTASSGTIMQNNAAGTWSWSATGADGPATSTVTITATDTTSATGSAAFTFQVINVAPAVAISAPASANEDAAMLLTFTATDPSSVDQAAGFAWTIDFGDGTLVATAPAGTASPFARAHTFVQPGSYTITARVTDKDGAPSAATTHTITIRDISPPVFTSVPPNVVVEATSASGAIVSYAAATATDNVDVSPAITYSQASGALFPIGVTTVTVTATDSANNTRAATFTVSVIEARVRIEREGNSFRLSYFGIPGRTYTVQFTRDLQTPDWQTLGTGTTNAQGTFEHLDTPPPGTTSRFYRTIYP